MTFEKPNFKGPSFESFSTLGYLKPLIGGIVSIIYLSIFNY